MKIEVKDGKVSIQIDGAFTAEQLTQLAVDIGEARRQIASDGDTPNGQPVYLPTNGRYWAHYIPELGGTVLMFKLPTTGWTGMPLAPAEVANLMGELARQLATGATATATAANQDDPPASTGAMH